jgi:[ribosomal protein S18]-alanine N-acetyltransferase
MIKIRAMDPEDIPEIHGIERASFADPWSSLFFYIIYTHPKLHCWTARSNGSIGGYICFEDLSGTLHLQNLAVRKEMRKRGIAQKLMNQLLRYARSLPCENIRLEVSQNNHAALELYQKNQFRQQGYLPAYYEHDGSDALVLIRGVERT